MDSDTKEVFITESYGTLQNDNGVGMLVFGDIPASYLELKNKFLILHFYQQKQMRTPTFQ